MVQVLGNILGQCLARAAVVGAKSLARDCSIRLLQEGSPQPADITRVFRVFVLDIGIDAFAIQTWVSVALVAMWTTFVVSGLLALDQHNSADMEKVVFKSSSKKKKTPLLLNLAQTIHQVPHVPYSLCGSTCLLSTTGSHVTLYVHHPYIHYVTIVPGLCSESHSDEYLHSEVHHSNKLLI